ncbi:MAG TPA: methyltransferase domain-containing protein [Candidatus Saccharimonadaceae bacterium]|nr:methyltransferase domain-containing protein [Candidatus Saccharimonadaceae bacterium]
MSEPRPGAAPEPGAFTARERTEWSGVAAGYADSFAKLTALAVRDLIEDARVSPGDRLLDVACGTGIAAAAAARRGAVVNGVDLAPAMVDEARRLVPTGTFRESDAAILPFADASLDVIVSNFGVHHFEFPEHAFAEMARVLVPGGRLAFSLWDAPERSVLHRALADALAAHGRSDVGLPPGPPPHRLADPAEARRTLEAAGFERVASRAVAFVTDASDANELFDAYERGSVRMGATLRAQTPAELAAIRAAFTGALAGYVRDGRLAVPLSAIVVSARLA